MPITLLRRPFRAILVNPAIRLIPIPWRKRQEIVRRYSTNDSAATLPNMQGGEASYSMCTMRLPLQPLMPPFSLLTKQAAAA